MVEVVSTENAQEALHRIARQFEAGEGEPVYFGSGRRAQGVIVPVEVWERLLEGFEDDLDREVARQRVSAQSGRPSTRIELDEAFQRAKRAADPAP